ncbi:acyl-CoA dehydrogenase family protein [Microbacterium sp. No. 7]|uniref:acyl-CoA dehydrogenase family protein n=1 Tax=Microbacterium sp. No. 7 TaxID=1714373 RepID=UPI0006CFEB24|nr:acyl-CoA dehydrogenase family protein [Microbacterium sp. No. 7]ALJ21725.1 acyl-CoA dehydrogenase [Microbacterium sp. No. 7]
MFSALTEEQREFRELVRGFLAEKSTEADVRRLMATEQGYDPQLWRQMAEEVGLQGIAIAEEHGGQGFGWIELGIVLEEMGRVLLCAPYFSTVVLAASAIAESGDAEAAAARLPGIADGSTIATLAFPGENGRWDAEGVTARATREGGSWRISGTAPSTIDGHVASLFVVPARTDEGVSLFLVDRGDGVASTSLQTLDQTRRLAVVTFDGAAAEPLGEPSAGAATLERVLDLAAVGLAAEQAGAARAAFDMSVAYLKERVQFGQPIGAFQALKHMAADVLIEVESASSASSYALWAAAESRDQLPAAASLAAAFCTDALVTACHQNIQFHGGMGFTWEVPAHLYFKRARADEILLGDADFHRERLAQRIGV